MRTNLLAPLFILGFLFTSCGDTESSRNPATSPTNSSNNSNNNNNNNNNNNGTGGGTDTQTLNVVLQPVADCTADNGGCPGVYKFDGVLSLAKTATAKVHVTYDNTPWDAAHHNSPLPPGYVLGFNCRLQICQGNADNCAATANSKDLSNLYWLPGPAISVNLSQQGQNADLEPTLLIPAYTPYRVLCFFHPFLFEMDATRPKLIEVRRQ